MAEVELRSVVDYLDRYLATGEVEDARGAVNGLQLENGGRVSRVAAAVDASERTVTEAVRRGCDLLIVHHGLFWGGGAPVTGRLYRKLEPLMRAGVAVYSSHLPLDRHSEVGNNVVLAKELGIEIEGTFAGELGCWGRLELKREALAARLNDILGVHVRMLPFGPEVIRKAGVITGGAGSMIDAARAAGLDAFVTGEGAHHTYFDAEEGQINVYYGGHYATETWGVRALAAHLADQFGLPWEFIDHPTGL